MSEISEIWMGPAMSQLREKQRRFVLAMASDPFGTATSWAKAAGYSDKSEGAKVAAHHNVHNAKVKAAIEEVARATMGTMGPMMAVHGLLNMARNGEHPQHAKAVEMLLNRTGFAEKQQIEVTHRDLTGDALIARLKGLAERMGLDAEKLIGANVSRDTKVIEHVAKSEVGRDGE